MRLLLFAEEQASKGWWFDLTDRWGNSASVVGLLLAVIAFPVTWGIQWRIRRANRKALLRVAFMVLSVAVEDLHRQLTDAREAGRLGVWLRAFDCCRTARLDALRLLGNPHLTQDEKTAMRTGADDLTQVVQYIEVNKLVPNPSPAFQQDKRDILDTFVTVLTNIQARLGTRTWEV